jgi:hypothetical protein
MTVGVDTALRSAAIPAAIYSNLLENFFHALPHRQATIGRPYLMGKGKAKAASIMLPATSPNAGIKGALIMNKAVCIRYCSLPLPMTSG